MTTNEQRLSDAVARPLITAYRAGGFGLAILVLGALLMLSGATVLTGAIAYGAALAGFALVLVPCYYFYVREIRPLARAQVAVERNREMIDAIQDTAILMTDLTMQLQAVAFKHADKVATTIETVRPIVASIGPFRKIADHPKVVSTHNLALSIVRTTEHAREVLDDVRAALVASDPSGLKKYQGRLAELKVQLVEVLAAADDRR